MKPSRHSHPERESIDTAAADWLIAHDRGLTAAEEPEFARWLHESPLHAQAWAEARAAWKQFDRLPELPAWSLETGNELRLVTSRRSAELPRAARWKLALPWAAAAAVVVSAASAFWWIAPQRAPSSVVLNLPEEARVVTVSPRKVFLPDGSRVELNAGSQIVEEFTASERHVRLVQGEAHFTVTKDAARPFIVDANGVTVRAVGTAFSVKLDTHAVEVLVTEGTVRLEEERSGAVIPRATELLASDRSFLDAGRRAIIPLAGGNALRPEITDLAADEISRALAWQAVRLKFADLSLDRVAAEFNRLNTTQLIVAESARDTVIAGTFRADNVTVFVEFMESAFGLTADRRADGTIVLSKAR